ncbi:antibiotic biosynthesis monooxygenase [Yaniella flava]|uniref:Antibiotic biosynthesis monooxygenase n=1 Tax=Yaniella flava TaxID=287930 RepID=A0ABP5GEZ6_9MICC
MSIVVINALSVPAGQGSELEARFAARKHAVDQAPGFEGFNLLRPTGDNEQYFVYTQWASREDYESWRDSRDNAATHASEDGKPRQPVATGAELLEFDIVEL